jgi:2-haloacid dehalogenase
MSATAIVFDVGNVLLRWDAALLLRQILPDDAAIDAFMTEVDFPAWNLAQDAGRSWDDGVAILGTSFPHHAETASAFHARWHESLPGPVPGSVEILETLVRDGRPLYAITNYSAEKWAETLPRFPFLARSFRDVVVSAHEGVTKPDARIYAILCERNGLRPADCVFIDDSAANIAGAIDFGMDAIRFTDAPALAAALRERRLLA